MRNLLPILLLLLSSTAWSQDAVALRILNAAIDKLGGEAKIRSLRSIYFSAKGFEDSLVNAQPYSAGKEARNPHEEKLAVFLDVLAAGHGNLPSMPRSGRPPQRKVLLASEGLAAQSRAPRPPATSV